MQFQSTLPARGATQFRKFFAVYADAFQSTLPARGATLMAFDIETTPLISIHAPRTGSDNTKTNQSVSPAISIHAPRTGSDSTRPLSSRGFIFQSTLPARGATDLCAGDGLLLHISIHAPRTGSDVRGQPHRQKNSDFNPRSPHGERPSRRWCWMRRTDFNPRSPHGERPGFTGGKKE